MKNNNNLLKKVIEKIDSLPQVFNVAILVLNKLEDPEVNVSELADLINMDQALTSYILKLCNSAYYGFSRKIATIQDAIPKLGLKTLKSVVFLAVSQTVLSTEVKGYDLAKNALWINSISCAIYAKHVAQKVGYKDAEIAFTAGLLRDIGKLIIHEYVGVHYNSIIELVNKKGITFLEAETETIGFNHTNIGTELAKKWNFPEKLLYSIEYHHEPSKLEIDKKEITQLVNIVHIADLLTMILGVGMGNDGMMYRPDSKALDELGLTQSADSFDNLIFEASELNSKIEEMAGLINA